MVRFTLNTCLGVLLALSVAPAWADVVAVNQVSGRQFTDLNGGSPSDGTLSGEFPSSSLLAQSSGGTITHRFGFEFPLTTIPTGAMITSATLTASEQADAGGGSTIYGRAGDGTVDQGDLFDTSNLLGSASSGPGNGTAGPVTLDVTSIVQSLRALNQSFLAIAFLPGLPTGSYRITNFDGPGANVDPTLTVNFVTAIPEMSSFLLLAAVGAFVGLSAKYWQMAIS